MERIHMNKEISSPKGFAALTKSLTESQLFGSLVISVSLLIVMLIIKPNYLSAKNIYALATVLAVTAIIGFSQMVIIATGGLNLSIGSIGALSAVIAGWAMTNAGISWPIAILLSLLTGLACGLVNGLLIFRAGGINVSFFLTTLATSSVFMGLNLTITRGNPFYGPGGSMPKGLLALGTTKIFGLPSSFYIMVIIAIALFFLFVKLSQGRQILAYGANHKAAELYGVSKFRVVLAANLLSGLLASVAGVLALIRIEAAQPNMGTEWLLMSFAAPLIGGSLLNGGRINVIGAILGAVALTIISNGLIHLKVDTYWSTLIYGIIILVAVTIDRLRYIAKRGMAA